MTGQSAVLSFKAATETFATITPPKDARNLLTKDDVRFTWNRFPGADAYKLVITEKTQSGEDETTEIKIDGEEQVNPANPTDPPYEFVKLEEGKQYEWRVDALSGKTVIARTSDQSFTTRPGLFSKVAKAGFALQRAISLGDSGLWQEPATFGYSAQSGSSPYLNAEFALIWRSRDLCGPPGSECPAPATLIRIDASVEGRLNSSGDAKQNDAFKASVGAYANLAHGDGVTSALLGSFKYETDRETSTRKEMLEILYTPTRGCVQGAVLPIGTTLPCNSHDYTGRTGPDVDFTYMWRPYFGVDVGHTNNIGTSLENEKQILRGIARLHAQVDLLQLARILSLPQVSIFVDDTYRYLFRTTNQRSNNYFQMGMDFYVSEGVSVALRGNIGRDAPNFSFSRDFSINLGLRFE